MENKREDAESPPKVSTQSQLEALNCLAATAGKLFENVNTKSENEEMPAVSSETLPTSEEETIKKADKISYPNIISNVPPLTTSSTQPHHYSSSSEHIMQEFPFMNNVFSIPSPKTTQIFTPPRPEMYGRLSPKNYPSGAYNSEKTFNALSLANSHSSYVPPYMDPTLYSEKNLKTQDKPPLLFGMDSLLNDSTLFETLVQESQKMLSKGESAQMTSIKSPSELSMTERDNDNNSENSLPPKLVSNKKRRSKPLEKRTHGGPPFKPGSMPPKENTLESALCTFHEHTLLKMATRGFWSGDKGPLQDVFRLARVENSDLQYNMKEITEHCYNMIKTKVEAGDASEKEKMNHLMKSYVEEFDSYLERIYPVSSVAINIYLPTATDYMAATWHGIVPTGWSEYRRAVVIREVFEVLHYLSSTLPKIPDFHSSFFTRNNFDESLLPVDLPNCPFNKIHDQNPYEPELDAKLKDNITYSRFFYALWTRTAPHHPYLILEGDEEMQMKDYLERCPIERFSPPDNAVIVVDKKKYKAREVLGYFRRGVQLVDYTKDTGGTIIDTVSTLRHSSMSCAVRKIPPGKISKLVHPNLHLENYTNPIIEIDGDETAVRLPPTKVVKNRKRKVKRASSDKDLSKLTPPDPPPISSLERDSYDNMMHSSATNGSMKLQSISTFCSSLDQQNNMRSYMKPPDLGAMPHLPEFSLGYPYPPAPPLTSESRSMSQEDIRCKMPRSPSFPLPSFHHPEKRIDGLRNPVEIPSPAGIARPKPEYSDPYTADILSSMNYPLNNSEMFSLHISSYRRAAKYLLDTANHLELVARRMPPPPPPPPVKKETPKSTESE